MRNKKSFSLIETLVATTLIIFGIVSVVSVMSRGMSTDQTNDAQAIALRLAQESIESINNSPNTSYAYINSTYASSLSALAYPFSDYKEEVIVTNLTTGITEVQVIVNWAFKGSPVSVSLITMIADTSLSSSTAATPSTNTSTSTSTGCFVAGTKVLLADGKSIDIENIKIGDILLGSQGARNKVIKLVIHPKADYKLFAINGGKYFITANHAMRTTVGWEAIDPLGAIRSDYPELTKIGQLQAGDTLMTRTGRTLIEKIESKIVKNTCIYNFVLDGSHDFYADGYLVHNVLTTQEMEL